VLATATAAESVARGAVFMAAERSDVRQRVAKAN
jgi:hypothetical protein